MTSRLSNELKTLITDYAILLPKWRKAYTRDIEAHAALVTWRISNRDIGIITFYGEKQLNCVCGFDDGVEHICNHFEAVRDDRTTQQKDADLETAIDLLSEAVKQLEAHSVYREYREARDTEIELYWQLIEIENAILAFPAIEKPDLIAKAKWIAQKDWGEPENCDAAERLIQSFEAIAAL